MTLDGWHLNQKLGDNSSGMKYFMLDRMTKI